MRSAILVLAVVSSLVAAAPAPRLRMRGDAGSAYTGAGGQAIGGSNTDVNNNAHGGLGDNAQALDVLSGNAGDGGKATSGTAFGGDSAGTVSWVNGHAIYTAGNGGSAYSGVGGITNGGNVAENNYQGGATYAYGRYGSLDGAGLDNVKAAGILSNNAGDGGDSSSGDAYGGDSIPSVPINRYYA